MIQLGRRAQLRFRFVSTAVLVVAAGIFVTGILASATANRLGFDFRFQYYDGARAVLEGEPLYSDPDDASLPEAKAYVYPPPLAVLAAPAALVSRNAAVIAAMVGVLVAIVASLVVVGVRDPRCYAVVLLSGLGWNAFETANVSVLLMLAVALVWRLRRNTWLCGTTVGLAIAIKLFLWPLAVWAFARERRAGMASIAVCSFALALSWAAIGFQGLLEYPDLVRRVGDLHAEHSYSVVGMTSALGLGQLAGQVLTVLVGGALLVACAAAARRGDDFVAFTWGLAAAVALSPIVWQHYLLLLLLPFAIARPRFSPAWLVPMTLWVSPRAGNGEGLETFLPAAVAVSLVVLALVQPRPRRVPAGEVAV